MRPLPFLLPLPKGFYGRTRLRIGMHLYDALSYDKTLPPHRILGPDELARVEPGLDTSRFHGAALFYDCQCAVAGAPDARERHRRVRARRASQNYTEVVGAIHDDDRLVGVKVKNVLDGEAERAPRPRRRQRQRPVVRPRRRRHRADAGAALRTTKGIHIACEPFHGHAIVLESSVDGRTVFAIPWMGHTWIGTTDTDFEAIRRRRPRPTRTCAT